MYTRRICTRCTGTGIHASARQMRWVSSGCPYLRRRASAACRSDRCRYSRVPSRVELAFDPNEAVHTSSYGCAKGAKVDQRHSVGRGIEQGAA